jgi:hypothetical protein
MAAVLIGRITNTTTTTTLWVDYLNQKRRIPITQSAIAEKNVSIFKEIQQKKKVETRHLLVSKDGLQGSSNDRKFFA